MLIGRTRNVIFVSTDGTVRGIRALEPPELFDHVAVSSTGPDARVLYVRDRAVAATRVYNGYGDLLASHDAPESSPPLFYIGAIVGRSTDFLALDSSLAAVRFDRDGAVISTTSSRLGFAVTNGMAGLQVRREEVSST